MRLGDLMEWKRNSAAAPKVSLLVAILSLMVLGTGPLAGATETIADWDFSRQDDLNFDGLADGWKREFGEGYPHYLTFAIEPHNPEQAELLRRSDAELLATWRSLRHYLPRLPSLPPSLADLLANRYLRAQLDGGALKIASPRFEVFATYSYRVRLRLRSEGLTHNEAWAEIVFYDGAGRLIDRVESQRLGGTSEWIDVQIGPVAPPDAAIAAEVRLRLESDDRTDMTGAAGFDDIRVEHLPRILTVGDSPLGIYSQDDQPRIRCVVSGLSSPVASVEFSLLDENDEVLQSETLPLGENAVAGERAQPTRPAAQIGYGGTAEWQLPSLGPGFYRVRASLSNDTSSRVAGDQSLSVEHSVAVLANLPPGHSPFGWSLAGPRTPAIPHAAIPDWLSQCHVSWVKYPCWVSPDDTPTADALARLMARLADRGIETVGVLDRPPTDVLAKLGARQGDPAALLFRDVAAWQPLLEPIMTRLGSQTRWWQLGGERDYSFLGRSQLVQMIEGIGQGLQSYGEPIRLVLSWPWLETLPPEQARSWQTVCLSDSLPPTAAEINAYFSEFGPPVDDGEDGEDGGTSGSDRGDAEILSFPERPWILLDPLPAHRYGRTDRIRDLVLQMVAVRQQRIPAAFVSDPFDPEVGLLRPDGTPGEMLLPWRTAAALVGPLQPLGSIEFPQGSDNVVMGDDSRTMLVLWSDSPTTETLYLGENPIQVDVWGRQQPLQQVVVAGRAAHRIRVGPQPTFITGVDRTAAMWQMAVRLEPQRIDSLLGREQAIRLSFENPSSHPISGSFQVRSPETWNVDRLARPVVTAPHGEQSEPIAIVLRADATTGRQRIAIDFDLEGDRERRFTVWRYVEVGPKDVQIDITTRLLPDGRLLVRQKMSVLSDAPQQFDCYLYAPGRQRQRRGLTIPGRSTIQQEFYWPDGAALVGREMLLQAEQAGTERTLNHRFTVER